MGIAYGTTTLHQATKGIVQDGLVLNFDSANADNTSSSIKDLSSYNRTLTLSNSTGAIKSIRGPIYALDGTNENIIVVDTNNEFRFQSSAFSVGIWFRLESGVVNQGALLRIIGKQAHANTNVAPYWYIYLYANGTGGVTPQFRSNGVNESTSVYTYGSWAYVVSTNSSGNGGTTKIYHNASQVVSGTTVYTEPYGYNSGFPVRIGNSSSWNSSFYYDVGPTHVYNKELSAAEVLQNFNVMRHRFGI